MRAWGWEPDELQGATVDVWPDNRAAVRTFLAMRNQWRTGGMGGATGLDFGAWRDFARYAGAADADLDAIFSDLLLMENVALTAMHEDKDKPQ